MCVSLLTGCFTSLSCSICQKVNSSLANVTRFYYGSMLMFSTLTSTLMLSDWVSHEMKNILSNYWFSDLVKHPDVPKEVIGSLAVYRVMSGVCLFHLSLSGMVINVKETTEKRAIIHNDGMGIKLIMYAGTIVSMFFVSSDVFIYLTTWPFKIGGASFIMLQIMFLISFIYDLYEGLVELADKQRHINMNERSIIWANCLSLFLTISGYIFTIGTGIILTMKHINSEEGCPQEVIASGFNIIMMLIVSVLSISDYVRGAQNGAGHLNCIFQASLISAYASYLILTAFVNHPDQNCHLWDGHHAMITKSVSLILTFIAIIWSTVRSGSNHFLMEREQLLPLEDIEGNPNENSEIGYSYSQFHIMFSLASMYIANILTRWGDIDIIPGEGVDKIGISDSELSVWIKLLSAGSCYLFYLWIMLAPPMFPYRNFS